MGLFDGAVLKWTNRPEAYVVWGLLQKQVGIFLFLSLIFKKRGDAILISLSHLPRAIANRIAIGKSIHKYANSTVRD